MTHDELLARACAERNELDAEVQLLRLQNLTLSAKLKEVEADYVSADHLKAELAGCVEERDALRVKLEEAQAGRQQFINVVEALKDDAGRIAGPGPNEIPILWRVKYIAYETVLGATRYLTQTAEASPGEIVKACPNCGAQADQSYRGDVKPEWRHLPGWRPWLCCQCKREYEQPAYYQKVKGPRE